MKRTPVTTRCIQRLYVFIYGHGRDNALKQLREEIDKMLKGKHRTPIHIQHGSQASEALTGNRA